MDQFAHVFKNTSLFHYFSTNVDVIEMISKKFKDAEEDKLLTKFNEYMPLAILHPNENNMTALENSLKEQRPRCFELMLEMLCNYEHQFLSKMMLESMPEMIA